MTAEDDIETLVPVPGSPVPVPGSPVPVPGSPLAPGLSPANVTEPGPAELTAPGRDDKPLRSHRRTLPSSGDQLGPFVIERLLGRGAMGVVLLAHDPELERRVAIKLLATDDHAPTSRTRLLREAQSAAGISHPNVVAIHQVGTHDDHVYIVMEHVDGGTLGQWRAAKPRTWREIVGVYLQAGRGLAAAHRLGLVHRDFKPDNALIGADGRVRVSDFGLVGRDGDLSDEMETLRSSDGHSARLTQTGAVMGTPAYMPPEQIAGERVDARADQFSYCVTLFEALWGHRPYRGDTLATIACAMDHGDIDRAPPDEVPDGVRLALYKGLSRRPADRHANMDALLAVLRGTTTPGLRRAPLVATGLAIVGASAAGAYWVGAARDSTPLFACPDAQVAYGEAWSEQRRAGVEQAFSVKPAGAAMFEVLDAELEARHAEWLAGHRAACEARAAGTQTDSIFSLRMQCLLARQAEADVFSELLTGQDERLLDGALSSSTTLLPIVACEDIEALQAAPKPTPSQLAALPALRRELARARILLLAGRHQELIKLLDTQLPLLREVGFAADIADALEILARAQMQLAEYDAAEANLREALTLAARARAHGIEARATGTLIFIVGRRQQRYAEAAGMLPAGRAAAARSPDPRAASYLEAAIATLYLSQDKVQEAHDAMNRVIATLEGLERPPADELANAYAGRADIRLRDNDPEGAMADHERALQIARQGLGEDHPFTGGFAMQLALALQSRGEYERALATFDQTLRAWELHYGRDHSNTALIMLYIGLAHRAQGSLTAAAAAFGDGIARHERSDTTDRRGLLSLVDNLAFVHWSLGEWDASWAEYERARALAAQDFGPNAPEVARYDEALGAVLVSQAKYAESIPYLESARELLVARHGPKHPAVALASTQLGDVQLYLGDVAGVWGPPLSPAPPPPPPPHYASALRIRSDLALTPDLGLARVLLGSGVCDLLSGSLEAAAESVDHAARISKDLGGDDFRSDLEFARARLAWRRGEKVAAHELARSAASGARRLGIAQHHRVLLIDAWRSAHAIQTGP